MKRLLQSLALALFAFAPFAVSAETITDFHLTATLDPSRTVIFEEKITYDFGDEEKHGIYRFIPENYERSGARFRLRLKVLDVTRDGKPEPHSDSQSDGDLNIKIGDADVKMSGAHTYVIRYSTDRAINSFGDHDELYWNVTGNAWPVVIEKASVDFILPPAADAKKVTSVCYTGATGETGEDCKTSTTSAGAHGATTRLLMPYEGFTVAFAFPPGIVHELTTSEKIWQFVKDNAVLAFPIVAFIIMFWMWWTRGKDRSKGTVIPEYEPPQKLSPAMVGAAMTNGDVPGKTATATIIDLARRGYLKIRFEDKKRLFGTTQDFTFLRDKQFETYLNNGGNLTDFEKDILDGLFDGGDEQSIDDLKTNKFYESVSEFKKHVQKQIDGMKLFDANPSSTRVAYLVVSVIIGVIMNIVFAAYPLGFIAAMLTGFIIAGFGWLMPRRTPAGTKLLTDIEGFKWFLSVTEKDRMAFHNAPERKPEQFQALLPYAIVFGVEKQWAAQFASMQLPPPDWATGAMVANMNMTSFTSSLGSLHTAASTSAYASPSSGGSGFSGGSSGGGGGGGGGGSW